MTIWVVIFILLTAWCLLVTFVGIPTPIIVTEGGEISLIENPHEDEVFSVEDIISLKQGEARVIMHVMFEEVLWRFAPLCIFAVMAPNEAEFWWKVMIVFAVAFAVAHIQYSLLFMVLVHLPLGIVWGTIYLSLLEWFGASGLVCAFIGVSVWHSIPNLKVFRHQISKLAQL